MLFTAWLEPLLLLAGAGQIVLVFGSLAIPKQLGWREKLAPTTPLIRQMFWVYAAYILATNLAFGLLSALAPAALLTAVRPRAIARGYEEPRPASALSVVASSA